MPAGSVMLFDSALWHGGGANTSGSRRFALSCAYCWGWMRQQENLQLGIPQETARRFPRRLLDADSFCGDRSAAAGQDPGLPHPARPRS